MSEITVRAFDETDWTSVWPLIREVANAGETYAYPRPITEAQARALWLGDPGAHILVAEGFGHGVLGSAKIGANRAGPGGHVATASFMVKVTARGRGVGSTLGRAALDWARDEGFLAMQFNAVVETNKAAVALWTALGFKVVGSVPAAFKHPALGFVSLLVMHRFLPTSEG